MNNSTLGLSSNKTFTIRLWTYSKERQKRYFTFMYCLWFRNRYRSIQSYRYVVVGYCWKLLIRISFRFFFVVWTLLLNLSRYSFFFVTFFFFKFIFKDLESFYASSRKFTINNVTTIFFDSLENSTRFTY